MKKVIRIAAIFLFLKPAIWLYTQKRFAYLFILKQFLTAINQKYLLIIPCLGTGTIW
jgi:hypothetical protein